MLERKSINSESGNIVSAGYDPQEQKMHVEFKGGKVYEYDAVPPEKWAAFEETFDDAGTSTGSHFHKAFKGEHESRQL